ncbi:MAG TPA: GspH/FimT family pseudopilin [Steroidobacteraceae bacterium]|nr:GspH/FimT family pseudopilin [Steroidobacteraceae bacterium]
MLERGGLDARTNVRSRLTRAARLAGLTLVELLAVVAVMAILATLAVPSFGSLRRTAAVGAVTTELVAALHFARSAAALDARPVTLCLSADGQTCVPSARDTATGWLIFVQPDAGVTTSAVVVPPVLRQFRAPEGVAVHGSRAAVTFWPGARASLTSTFDVCDVRRAVAGRAVVVSQTGRPRVAVEEAACAP